MTGAMYAAIAGLKTHMQNLNVIGNNIANINTYSYKAGRSVFQTSLYTQISGGSNGTTVTGGVNPSQIGYGVTLGSVDVDFSSGNFAATGRSQDLMLDGEGFFLVGDKSVATTINPDDPSTLTALTLTRVGDVGFKGDGYLTNYNGDAVYGFLCTGVDQAGNPIFSDQLVPIRYPRVETITDPNDPDGTIKVVRYPTAAEGERLQDYRPEDAADDDEDLPFAAFSSITFDKKTGIISGICKDTSQSVTIGVIAVGNVTNPDGLTQESNSYYKASEGAGNFTISLLGGAAETLGIRQVNGSLSAVQDEVNAAMEVRNAGKTRLMSGGLEMSKTDLAAEISNMITTQRGYQANTRIITVTDSMLEELVNMKR